MHLHFLDPYQPRASLVHRLDPRIKLGLAFVFILTVALVPLGAWAVYVLLWALMLVIILLSELGVGWVLRRAFLAAPFVLAAAPLLFTVPGAPVLILPWGWAVSQPGLARFIHICLQSWLSVQLAIVLSASTAFPDLLTALRAWHVPRLLVAIFGLMWRNLFVLVDEVIRLMRARTARSGIAADPRLRPGGTVTWRAQVAGGMAGNLFVRGFERGERIYTAMLARGYDGEVRHLPLPPVPPAQWALFALSMVGCAALIALGWWLV